MLAGCSAFWWSSFLILLDDCLFKTSCAALSHHGLLTKNTVVIIETPIKNRQQAIICACLPKKLTLPPSELWPWTAIGKGASPKVTVVAGGVIVVLPDTISPLKSGFPTPPISVMVMIMKSPWEAAANFMVAFSARHSEGPDVGFFRVASSESLAP